MAERRPPGFNVPLGFYDGPEVKSIPRRIRAAAVGVWTLCGTFSANKLQDGYVGPETLKELGCTAAIRAALMATLGPDGEPDPLWIDARDGGVQFTKWVKYQRSRAEVKAYREAEAERKRIARQGKGSTSPNAATSGNGKTSGRTSGGQNPDVRSDHRDPKTETETKTEISSLVTSSGGVTSADAGESPRPHCPKHEENFDGPCHACKKRREWDETHESRVRADELDAKRRLREIAASCPDCHGTGVIDEGENDAGYPVSRRCDHGMADHA